MGIPSESIGVIEDEFRKDARPPRGNEDERQPKGCAQDASEVGRRGEALLAGAAQHPRSEQEHQQERHVVDWRVEETEPSRARANAGDEVLRRAHDACVERLGPVTPDVPFDVAGPVVAHGEGPDRLDVVPPKAKLDDARKDGVVCVRPVEVKAEGLLALIHVPVPADVDRQVEHVPRDGDARPPKVPAFGPVVVVVREEACSAEDLLQRCVELLGVRCLPP